MSGDDNPQMDDILLKLDDTLQYLVKDINKTLTRPRKSHNATSLVPDEKEKETMSEFKNSRPESPKGQVFIAFQKKGEKAARAAAAKLEIPTVRVNRWLKDNGAGFQATNDATKARKDTPPKKNGKAPAKKAEKVAKTTKAAKPTKAPKKVAAKATKTAKPKAAKPRVAVEEAQEAA